MEICKRCNKIKDGFEYYNKQILCNECAQELKRLEVVEKAENTTEPRDFKDWSGNDKTTAFFEIFGRYIKNPNEKDWKIIERIYYWACHENIGLSKTISYTFNWTGIKFSKEHLRWKNARKE